LRGATSWPVSTWWPRGPPEHWDLFLDTPNSFYSFGGLIQEDFSGTIGTFTFGGGAAADGAGPFVRGDCNQSGVGDLSDAVFLLNYLFLGGDRPPCLAACDVNSDARVVGVTDAVYLLGSLFLGEAPPASPFPDCDKSRSAGDLALGCEKANMLCE